ncbi:kinase-like domain-containing protein [Rhizophagus irregularis DAOM 181602=DAOM 197198]|nr:kinase-like domain-containing protein [Rhizophagus irregularis DAOM 181602=DAOM 197198]
MSYSKNKLINDALNRSYALLDQNLNSGFSEIYMAIWIDGYFIGWNTERQQLKRYGAHGVVLKRLENVENANQNWIEEAKSHLNISNKWKNHTSSSKLFTSKLHQFDNLPEPKNATEEEQEAFHSNKSYDYHIPNNVDDFDKLSSTQNDYKIGAMHDDDDDEAHNNPNLHSEEQDELELPDNI